MHSFASHEPRVGSHKERGQLGGFDCVARPPFNVLQRIFTRLHVVNVVLLFDQPSLLAVHLVSCANNLQTAPPPARITHVQNH
jgi:hypothetical protein